MKKLLVVLVTLLALTACASKGYSTVSDSNEVIFKGPDGNYTKQDLYKSLKILSEQPITLDIINKIAQIENVDMDEIEKEADDSIQSIIDQGMEFYISYYYGSTEAYKEGLISTLVYEELKKNYILEDYDANLAVDSPVKIQTAYFDIEDDAKKALEEMKAGTTFDSAVVNNGYTLDPQAKVVLDSDDLPIQVKSYLKETGTVGLSDIITTSTETSDADGNSATTVRYYIVNIVDNDVNNYKDEYLTLKAQSISDDTLINYLFSKYNVKFYDQDLYEIMSNAYEVLK